jgi:hypothetical protein
MSEVTRERAMHHAVAVCQADGVDAVLEAAAKFNAFIEGGPTDEAPAKPAAKPAAKAATTKPATTKASKPAAESEETVVRKATTKAAAAAEEEEAGEGDETTQEAVETIIADLLGANLRKQAVALLSEYGAKSASGVKAADRAEFVQRAGDLLLGT